MSNDKAHCVKLQRVCVNVRTVNRKAQDVPLNSNKTKDLAPGLSSWSSYPQQYSYSRLPRLENTNIFQGSSTSFRQLYGYLCKSC